MIEVMLDRVPDLKITEAVMVVDSGGMEVEVLLAKHPTSKSLD